MSWKEVSTGKWERPLDNNELVLKLVADLCRPLNKEAWAVNTIVDVVFSITEEAIVAALRRAWINTRYKHPSIATTLSGNNHVYQSPNDQELENWVSESFAVHKAETVANFLLTVPLLEYSSLHYFPSTSQILIRMHHWVIDGIGSIHVMNHFLTYLSADDPLPTFGDEHIRLSPGFLEAAGLPAKLAPSDQTAANDAFMSHFKNMPSVGLTTLPGALIPGGSKFLKLTFPSSVLQSLLAATRNHKLGLAAALHSAVILATRERAPEHLVKRNFTNYALFDYRKYLKEPFTDTVAWPLGVWMLTLPFSLPEADFMTTARELQAIYHQDMAVETCPALKWYDGFCGNIVKVIQQPLPAGISSPSHPGLSSMGSLDDKFKKRYEGKIAIDVKAVEPVLNIMSANINVFQWSFGGNWFLSACYNESYYTESDVVAFLGRIKEILFQELGVVEKQE